MKMKKWILTAAAAAGSAAICCAAASITASADAALSNDRKTLTLSGNVTKEEVRHYLSQDCSSSETLERIIAEEGTVLPADCSGMFYYYDGLPYAELDPVFPGRNMHSIDLSKADTSYVTDMSEMFWNCCCEELNLSGFDTSNVTDMSHMFGECYDLTELDLSSFDTSNVRSMEGMFDPSGKMGGAVDATSGFETIYVSDLWNTDAVTDSEEMFKNCTALTGGNGTVYNSEKTDKEYARIDKAGQPGYLTFRAFPGSSYQRICGASLTLDGRIGINFYTRLNRKAAKAVLEGPLGTVEIPAAQFDSLRVQDGDYAGCIKLTYGINATQRLNKVTLKLYDSEGSLLDLCKSNYELLPDKQFSYSAADYIDSYQDTGSLALTTLVTALERYFKSAENYFKGTSYEIFPEDYQYQWFDIFNDTNGAYKLSLVLNSGTDLRIYSDAEQILIRKTGDTYAALESETKNGKKYFVIPDIPAQKIVDSREIQIDGTTYYVCPRDWCYYAATQDGGNGKLYDLAMAFYEYGKAAEAYLWPNL